MDIFISSPSEAIDRFEELAAGNEFACVTAQPIEFLVYHEIAKQILLQKRPDIDVTDKVVLRYPWSSYAPQSTKELFSRFKPVEDFDTRFTNIAEYLISASPSLEQKDLDESAWAIFVNPERGELDVEDFVEQILMKEKVYWQSISKKIDQLIREIPFSECGVLTVITAEKREDVADFVYEALPYGLPGFDANNPQLRVVSAALLPSDKVKMHRVLLMKETELQAFSEKVKQVVSDIFLQSDQHLQALQKKIDQQEDPQEIALGYLKRCEIEKALPWVLKTDLSIRYEFFKMMGVLSLILQQLEEAKKYFNLMPEDYQDREKCLGMLAFHYLDLGLQEDSAIEILDRMKDGDEKNLVLIHAQGLTENLNKYPAHPDFTLDIQNFEKLFDLTVHPIFDDEDEDEGLEELQPLWQENLDATAYPVEVSA